MPSTTFAFVLAVLACWRCTRLLSKEDGPFDLVYRLRKRLGNGFFGRLLDCFYCLSIWLALPAGIWLGRNTGELFLYWLATSGGACLLYQVCEAKKTEEPLYKEDAP